MEEATLRGAREESQSEERRRNETARNPTESTIRESKYNVYWQKKLITAQLAEKVQEEELLRIQEDVKKRLAEEEKRKKEAEAEDRKKLFSQPQPERERSELLAGMKVCIFVHYQLPRNLY